MIFQPTNTSKSYATRENCQKFIEDHSAVDLNKRGLLFFIHIGENGRFYPVVVLDDQHRQHMRYYANLGVYTIVRN